MAWDNRGPANTSKDHYTFWSEGYPTHGALMADAVKQKYD